MKTHLISIFPVALALLAARDPGAVARGQTAPATNSVTASGLTAYVINGQQNPALILQRGVIYVFQVNAGLHPFYIKTAPTTGTGDQFTGGVTGNGVTVGTLTFAVPTNAPDLLYYHCGNHAPMGGELNIVTPPTPPAVNIVFISVTDTHVVLKSTGAAGWTPVPEFNSNLVSIAWAAVPGYTNTFADNTNTTGFDRAPLDAVCGPDVFFRIRNEGN